MFLNISEINACIHWLKENASPPVKYLTYIHILKADSQCVQELWRSVVRSNNAEEIFSRQNKDGSWFSGGPWGPTGYRQQTGRGYTFSRPKFVTTAWILPFLGEMGFTVADERIRRSCELMLRESDFQNYESVPLSQPPNCCGLFAIPLRAFASVGMAADKRLQGAWDWLICCQRTDGGWLYPNHLPDARTPSKTQGKWPWDRSCVWGSFFAVQALYYAKKVVELTAALEFLKWHLLQKDPKQIQTWVYHGHNIVRELLMFSVSGFDMHEQPFPDLLAWLKGYYRPNEGAFRTQEKPIPNFARQVSVIRREFEEKYGTNYWKIVAKTSAPVLRYHLFHLVEDDWLTYYMTRIALNMTPTIWQETGRLQQERS